MEHAHEIEYMRWFANQFDKVDLFSTGAKPVNYADILYNVTSSTADPKKIPGHKGKSWKDIIIDVAGLSESVGCYVTNVKPEGKSTHPQFKVGGHMTAEKSGVVPRGGVTYLMPLCSWHNSTARDEMAFKHDKTSMVELSGFMEGDTVATFSMRLPSKERFSAIYYEPMKGTMETIDLQTPADLTSGWKLWQKPVILIRLRM